MKLIAKSLEAANVAYGKHHPVRFGIEPDMTVNVPGFAVPDLLASGHFELGEEGDVLDLRSELERASAHELDVFLNTRADPDNPSSNIQTHWFNAHKHPLSDKAREAGVHDVADELDNLFQQHHIVVLKGSRGVICHATADEKRAYAVAYAEAEQNGTRPPSVPWRQKKG